MRPMDELLREDARRERRGDRASGEFPDLQSGVREGAVRLSRFTLGNAPAGADHFEVERGTSSARFGRVLINSDCSAVAGCCNTRARSIGSKFFVQSLPE
jgi:hypothetical protein